MLLAELVKNLFKLVGFLAQIQHSPEFFNGVEVWDLGRPCQKLNISLFQNHFNVRFYIIAPLDHPVMSRFKASA